MTNYLNSRWYRSAKIIGTSQKDVTFCMLFYLFCFVVLTAFDIIKTSDDDKWFRRLIIPTFVVLLSFRIWAAKQLIKATESEPTASAAYKCCKYWQIVSIAFVSITSMVPILGSYFRYDPMVSMVSMSTVMSCGAVIFIAFGEGMCYIRVNNFMQDLQSAVLLELLPSF